MCRPWPFYFFFLLKTGPKQDMEQCARFTAKSQRKQILLLQYIFPQNYFNNLIQRSIWKSSQNYLKLILTQHSMNPWMAHSIKWSVSIPGCPWWLDHKSMSWLFLPLNPSHIQRSPRKWSHGPLYHTLIPLTEFQTPE